MAIDDIELYAEMERDRWRGAVLSADLRFRYVLWRTRELGGKKVNFVGLNPSTADAQRDDATIRRCFGYARDWGYGVLLMTNLFAFRATYPVDMLNSPDPVGPDNDAWLAAVARECDLVVLCWGDHGDFMSERADSVRAMFPQAMHLGLTGKGNPRHPLRLPKTLKPSPFLEGTE